MGKHEKIVSQVLRGLSDANIEFDDLCLLLQHFGFELRIRGSHHIFRISGMTDKINLQRIGSKAKPYQVRQVRNLILKYRLAKEE